jgi:ribonuclease HII
MPNAVCISDLGALKPNNGHYPVKKNNRFNPLSAGPDLSFETRLWKQGINLVAGLDEVGRGALAGPVVAGAVVFESTKLDLNKLMGIRDSKQLTPSQRAEWSQCLRKMVWAWGIGSATPAEIDSMGIVPATRLAMCRALENLGIIPQHLLIDYIQIPECAIPQTSIVRGDARSMSIAAASILAKTARDGVLCEYDRQYPGYDFAHHKGYGTPAHLLALERSGPCVIHRRSFEPLKSIYRSQG